MPIRSANWIISAIPDPNTGVTHHDSRHAFLQALTEVGKIAVATHRIEDNEELVPTSSCTVITTPPTARSSCFTRRKGGALEDYEIEEQREF